METPRRSTVLVVAWVALAALVGVSVLGPVPGTIVAVVSPFALAAVASFAHAAASVRTWAALRGRAATASLEPGFTELEGTARAFEETLTAPRTDADVLAYEYREERPDRTRDHDADGVDLDSTRMATTASASEAVPFVVEGEGGTAVVDPDGAELVFEPETEREGSTRHVSERLDVGERVYVAGVAVPAREARTATRGYEYAFERAPSSLPAPLADRFRRPFLLSDGSEAAAEARVLLGAVKPLVFGIVLSVPVVVLGRAALYLARTGTA